MIDPERLVIPVVIFGVAAVLLKHGLKRPAKPSTPASAELPANFIDGANEVAEYAEGVRVDLGPEVSDEDRNRVTDMLVQDASDYPHLIFQVADVDDPGIAITVFTGGDSTIYVVDGMGEFDATYEGAIAPVAQNESA